MSMSGVLPPNYVRSVDVTNQTGNHVTLHATFQSKHQQSYGLAVGQKFHVERDINHGTWTAVDPIVLLTALGSNNSVLAEKAFTGVTGVQVLNLTLKVQFVDN